LNGVQPIQVYCDIDENGNIKSPLVGRYIIPDRQYDLFIVTYDEAVLERPELLRIEGYNGQTNRGLTISLSGEEA